MTKEVETENEGKSSEVKSKPADNTFNAALEAIKLMKRKTH